MAYTNKTANYELPQYVPTDQPTYLEDFNGAMFTIDSSMKENSDNIGDLSSLTTTAKNNLVSAVNEVNQNSGASLIGDLSNLTTTEKSTVVGAINEVDSNTDTNTTSIGTLSSLTTTVKTDLVSAINEVDGNTDTNSTSIGDLSTLTTTAKTDLVSAINEVASSSGGGSSLSKWELTTFDTYNAANWDTKGCTYTGPLQSLNAMSITIDANSDNSIFSVYGTLSLSASASGEITITFPTSLNNTNELEFSYSGLNIERISEAPIVKVKVENNGKLTIKFFAKSGNNYVMYMNIPRVINFS